MRRLAWLSVLWAVGCFGEPPPGDSNGDGATSQGSADSSGGAVSMTSGDPGATAGSSGGGPTTADSTGTPPIDTDDPPPMTTGGPENVYDLYDHVCEAMWSIDGTTALPCPSDAMAIGGPAIRQIPEFMLPELMQPARAIEILPSAGSDGFIQGVFVFGDAIAGLTTPRLYAQAVCATMPPAGACEIQMQIRWLRGGTELDNIDRIIVMGPSSPVELDLADAKPGDELVFIAFNMTDAGTNEAIVLIEPIIGAT